MKPLVNAILFTLPIILGGCLHVDCEYTPNSDVISNIIPESKKVPVYYSVKFIKMGDLPPCIGSTETKDILEKVPLALEKTKLFSSIIYADNPPENSYHIAFEFYLKGRPPLGNVGCMFIAIYSLSTIPVSEEFFLDGNAKIFLRGEKINSAAKTEQLQATFWLPFILTSPFTSIAWSGMEDGVINGLVNDVAQKHLQMFPN